MLDIKYILDNFDEVTRRLKGRDPSYDLTPLIELDAERRRLIKEVEDLQARRNAASKQIGGLKASGQDTSALLAEMKSISDQTTEMERQTEKAQDDLNKFIEVLPNIPVDPTPLVPGKAGNQVVKTWGTFVKEADWPFPFHNHLEVGKKIGIRGGLDFDRAAKMSGSGWALYRGDLARLEWALVLYLIDKATGDGLRELILPPFLVSSQSMYSSGQYPKFRDQAYETKDDDLVLLPTSEVALLNLYRDEILPEEVLPLRLASFTPCFRREAGTYGKGERGLIRIHQFNKVEIFSITTPENSVAELQLLIAHAESVMEELNLPYRTTLLGAGDIAQQAASTYDIEVWLPGQDTCIEVSSVSNCTDYQARRGSIRYKPTGKKKNEFVHTLNGSALATSRLMVAILEQYQQADGSLAIPKALVGYMGGKERIEATV
jgi:seryl-tRNA synthetase